jgi:DNA (cytosine-5)-methyltransferase 1
VLSLFPGIGLLDRAFEELGFCVVRGPDLLWGGDIRTFHPPRLRFDLVIGGPPCQHWSRLRHIVEVVHGPEAVAPDLIPEFVRVVEEALPPYFLMENVPAAPTPYLPSYHTQEFLLNNRWCGGIQNRLRKFVWGVEYDGYDEEFPALRVAGEALESAVWEPAVCSSAGGRSASVRIGGNGKPKGKQGKQGKHRLRTRTVQEQAVLQGLPPDFLEHAPFTRRGKEIAIGNGVPLPLGRAVAREVARVIGHTPPEASP